MPGRNASAMQASCAASDAAAEQRRIKSAVSYRSDLFEFPESICPCSFSPETSLRPDHGARTASPYAPRPDKKFRRSNGSELIENALRPHENVFRVGMIADHEFIFLVFGKSKPVIKPLCTVIVFIDAQINRARTVNLNPVQHKL